MGLFEAKLLLRGGGAGGEKLQLITTFPVGAVKAFDGWRGRPDKVVDVKREGVWGNLQLFDN